MMEIDIEKVEAEASKQLSEIAEGSVNRVVRYIVIAELISAGLSVSDAIQRYMEIKDIKIETEITIKINKD